MQPGPDAASLKRESAAWGPLTVSSCASHSGFGKHRTFLSFAEAGGAWRDSNAVSAGREGGWATEHAREGAALAAAWIDRSRCCWRSLPGTRWARRGGRPMRRGLALAAKPFLRTPLRDRRPVPPVAAISL